MSKKLNGLYLVEVISGRLNGSSKDVEPNKTGFDNVVYTKKIGGRGACSAVTVKMAIDNYCKEQEGFKQVDKEKIGKQIIYSPDPLNCEIDDIRGFMLVSNLTLTEDEYSQLSKEEQKFYRKDKTKYVRLISKKRRTRLSMSELVNVSSRRVEEAYHIATSIGDSMPYVMEKYSGIMAGTYSLDVDKVGQICVSDTEDYKDYDVKEGALMGLDEGTVQLPKEERIRRICGTLRGLQNLRIDGNQANYLTEVRPKVVILCEYSWGNSYFQGIAKYDGFDIEALAEAIDESNNFRLSDIWIGVSKQILDPNYQNLRADLEERFKGIDYIHVGTVGQAFNGYTENLTKTLE